jgi:hypothetical protein
MSSTAESPLQDWPISRFEAKGLPIIWSTTSIPNKDTDSHEISAQSSSCLKHLFSSIHENMCDDAPACQKVTWRLLQCHSVRDPPNPFDLNLYLIAVLQPGGRIHERGDTTENT